VEEFTNPFDAMCVEFNVGWEKNEKGRNKS
jgi:hypothetical protein